MRFSPQPAKNPSGGTKLTFWIGVWKETRFEQLVRDPSINLHWRALSLSGPAASPKL